MTSYFLRNSVSFIKLSNPPVNGLSLAVRDGIMRGLDQARADKTRGVVFFGHGKNFCAGGDIREFAKHQHAASPSLNEVRLKDIMYIIRHKNSSQYFMQGYRIVRRLTESDGCIYKWVCFGRWL